VVTCNQKRPACIQRLFRPELTATSTHLKPEIIANEPAFHRIEKNPARQASAYRRRTVASLPSSLLLVILVGIIPTVRFAMSTAEKISIALPREMVPLVRDAVATGEYASSSEIIREALRDWTYKRSLRQQGVAELRQLWQEALSDKTQGIAADDVLDRLERKYQAIADARRAK